MMCNRVGDKCDKMKVKLSHEQWGEGGRDKALMKSSSQDLCVEYLMEGFE